MKNRVIDIIGKSLLLLSTALVGSCGGDVDENGVPLEYSYREQYMEVGFTTYDVPDPDDSQVSIPINASSAWSASSSESWASPASDYYMGEENLVLNLELNRGEDRSSTITITMVTVNETFTHSFELNQEVSYKAEISCPTALSLGDVEGSTTLAVSYNYGIKAEVISGDWVRFDSIGGTQTEATLDASREEIVLKDGAFELYFEECGISNRTATILFSSTEDSEINSTLTITQIAKIDPVKAFVDDFSESNSDNSGTEFIFNSALNWRIQNLSDICFKHYYWAGNTTYVYPWTNVLAYNTSSEVESYMILPPVDLTQVSSDVQEISFWLGTSAGTVDNTAGTGSKLEIVYSKDFGGDALAEGTWEVLYDYSFTGVITNVLPKTCYQLSLAAFAEEENLTLAFRYTGGSPAVGYRIDNVRVGVAPHANQDQDDGDQYVLAN